MEAGKQGRGEQPERRDPSKKARVEEAARELFDPRDKWTPLPEEIKRMLIDAVAALHRGAEVVTGGDLEAVNRSFRAAMKSYIESKGSLLLRGTLGTTARLKLFFSGRWKSLTQLSWRVSFEIIMLNVTAAEKIYRFAPFLFMHKTGDGMGMWHVVQQSGPVSILRSGGEKELLSATSELGEVRFNSQEGPRENVILFGPRHVGASDTSIEKGMAPTEVRVDPDTVFDYAIMYGMAETFLALDVVASKETKEAFITNLYGVRSFFFEMIDSGNTRGLMEWKNKVVLFSVELATFLDEDYEYLGFWRWDEPEAFVLPPEDHPLRDEEWGYAFSSYFALDRDVTEQTFKTVLSETSPDTRDVNNHWRSIRRSRAFVAMPLPWFFFLLNQDKDALYMPLEFDVNLEFTRVMHKIKWKGMHIVSLPSRQIRTYQPYEMVVITRDASPEQLVELMMLQKHSVERARSRMTTW
jgi:hypothetical protein